MPAHVSTGDGRGKGRYEKRRIWTTPEGQCATCPAKLRSTDLKDGCRRCLACRKKNPGRPDPQTVRVLPNAEKPEPPTTSWWMRENLTREEFQSIALRKKFGQVKGMGISKSPADFRDV